MWISREFQDREGEVGGQEKGIRTNKQKKKSPVVYIHTFSSEHILHIMLRCSNAIKFKMKTLIIYSDFMQLQFDVLKNQTSLLFTMFSALLLQIDIN